MAAVLLVVTTLLVLGRMPEVLTSPIYGSTPDSRSKPLLDQGVLFIQEETFLISGDKWRIGLNVDLTPYQTTVSWVLESLDHLVRVTSATNNSTVPVRETLLGILEETKQIHDVARKTQLQVEAVLGTLLPKRRTQRAVIAPIGSALKYLFGCSTDADLHELSAKLDHYANTTENIVHLLSDQATIISKNANLGQNSRKDIETLEQALSTAHAKIRKFELVMTQQWRSSQEQLVHAMQLSVAVRRVAFVLTVLNQDFLAFSAAIRVTAGGKLDSYFITPSSLLSILLKARTFLPEDVSFLTELEIHEMYFYYDIASVKAISSGTSLHLFVDLPLRSSDRLFIKYQVVPFPVSIGNGQLAISVRPTFRYFAITPNRQRYVEFDDIDWMRCQGSLLKICPPTTPLVKPTSPSCNFHLFMGHSRQANESCEHSIIKNPRPSFARPWNSNVWYFSLADGPFLVECPPVGGRPGNITEVYLRGNGQLYMPAQCSAKGENVELLPHALPSAYLIEINSTVYVPPLSSLMLRVFNSSESPNHEVILGSSDEVSLLLAKVGHHPGKEPESVSLQSWKHEVDSLRAQSSIFTIPSYVGYSSGSFIIFLLITLAIWGYWTRCRAQTTSDPLPLPPPPTQVQFQNIQPNFITGPRPFHSPEL